MLDRDYFSHTIPGCGCLVYTWYDPNGLSYALGAARTSAGTRASIDADSPVRVHEGFMASPGTAPTSSIAAFTHGGVGADAADNQMFQGYVQNTRMYTELFMQADGGSPGAAAPAPRSARRCRRRRRRLDRSGAGAAGRGAGADRQAGDHATAPRRPTSSAGLDGVWTTVVDRRRRSRSPARRAADDARRATVGDRRCRRRRAGVATQHAGRARSPPRRTAGLFDGIVGTLLGFLFG